MTYPVNNLDDAYNACNPDKPLEVNDSRYLDLKEVRNNQNVSTLLRVIKRTTQTGDFCKQLLTGHTGSGKSTELKRLQSQLEEALYFVVYLDVESSLDLQQITYQDVLLNIAQELVNHLASTNIELDSSLLNDLQQWFADRIVSEDYVKEVKASASVSGQAGIDIPFIAKLLTKLTGEIRSGSSRRIEIRQNIEKEQQSFIAKLNDLLLAARIKLKNKEHTDLVIIIDGLEKIKQKNVYDALFLEHSEQLTDIDSHTIYTIPAALSFHTNLGNFFSDEAFFIPMVKYETPEGKQRLTELVNKRLNVAALFENPLFLDDLIAMCGGSVRDLLRLIRTATDTDSEKIQAEDIARAISSLVKVYDRLVWEEDVPLLKKVMIDKRVVKTEDKKYERLLSNRLIHEYENGKPWAALHPALTRITWLQTALSG
ncbi:MAG: AAA family ATPase [Methylococcaceae bacterium]|nr:AAA family ATPase [Methylococcaceae bacterium]